MTTLNQFISYCESLGLSGKCIESKHSFEITLDYATNKFTSSSEIKRLSKKFTQRTDSPSANNLDREYSFRLSKQDIHNELITGSFFSK
jgi:hypothetical protein